jgi:hypothetical protein
VAVPLAEKAEIPENRFANFSNQLGELLGGQKLAEMAEIPVSSSS